MDFFFFLSRNNWVFIRFIDEHVRKIPFYMSIVEIRNPTQLNETYEMRNTIRINDFLMISAYFFLLINYFAVYKKLCHLIKLFRNSNTRFSVCLIRRENLLAKIDDFYAFMYVQSYMTSHRVVIKIVSSS